MESENKCFFSVSLENGITITGNNPVEVKEFLTDLEIICTDALKQEQQKNDPIEWVNHVRKIRRNFSEAWGIIYNHIMNKEEEK